MQDDPNNLDRLIDDVAREMTGAPPAGGDEGLARRVSVRIQDAEAVRTPRAWSRAWLLAPAAACVLVLAVFLLRDATVRPGPDATPVQPAALSPQPSVPDTTGAMTRATEATARQTVRLTPSARATGVEKVDAAPVQAFTGGTDPDLQPLTMAPIEMASLDVSPLVVAMPIEISTIAIDRIEISAMP